MDQLVHIDHSYPTGPNDTPASAADAHTDHLEQLYSGLFTSDPRGFYVHMSDLSASADRLQITTGTLSSDSTVRTYLSQNKWPSTRIISFFSQNSLEPLQISRSAMAFILQHHRTTSKVFDVLQAFGSKARKSEVALGGLTRATSHNVSRETSCVLPYAEHGVNRNSTTWTVRQIGIYHLYDAVTRKNLWILVHVKRASALHENLTKMLADSYQARHIHENPLAIIMCAYSTYCANWRLYLNHLNEELESLNDIALTMDFSEDIQSKRISLILQKLQHIQDQLSPLIPIFRSSVKTLNTQKPGEGALEGTDCERAKAVYRDDIDTYSNQLEGHIQTVKLMKQEIDGIFRLFSSAIGLEIQMSFAKTNNHMLELAKGSVDESITVQVITFVSLLYLPASLVASVLGMNLFTFEPAPGAGFQISPKFWIFVVATIPLTVITLGAWFLIARRRRQKQPHLKESQESL